MDEIFDSFHSEMDPNRTVLFVAVPEDFADLEYLSIRRMLVEAGYNTEITSLREGECFGMFGTVAYADFAFNDVELENYIAVVFLGGIGCQNFYENKPVFELARKFFNNGTIIGALSEAPIILLNAGILQQGQQVTSWSGHRDELVKNGLIYTGDTVTIDGKIITAQNTQAAQEFAQKLIKMFNQHSISEAQ